MTPFLCSVYVDATNLTLVLPHAVIWHFEETLVAALHASGHWSALECLSDRAITYLSLDAPPHVFCLALVRWACVLGKVLTRD